MSIASALLDHWQRGYLKFQGRDPRTLEELAVAEADMTHSRRLAEIKALRAKLALLDPFVAPLAARGIRLGHREFRTIDHGKTVLLYPQAFAMHDDALHAALVDLGFREVERKLMYPTSRCETVTLKHGRSLLIRIEVTRAKPADPAPEPAASPTAELAQIAEAAA